MTHADKPDYVDHGKCADPVRDAFATIEDALADARRERDAYRGALIAANLAHADAAEDWEVERTAFAELAVSLADQVARLSALVGDEDANGYRVGG